MRKTVSFMSLKTGIVLWLVGLLLSALLPFQVAVAGDKVKILTTSFPPYVRLNSEGKPSGPAVSVVREAFDNAGIFCEIEIQPWARAYTLAKTIPDTFIFSIARRPNREDLFQWVGTVAPYKVRLFKLSSSAVPTVENWSDLRDFRMAGQLKDVKALFLKDHGFDVYFVPAAENTIKMLYASRVDLVAGDSLSLPYRASLLGLDPAKLAVAANIPELSSDLYLAAQVDSKADVLARVRKSLQALKDEGRFDAIWRRMAAGS